MTAMLVSSKAGERWVHMDVMCSFGKEWFKKGRAHFPVKGLTENAQVFKDVSGSHGGICQINGVSATEGTYYVYVNATRAKIEKVIHEAITRASGCG
ncbi:MAG: hypothetical protein GY832_22210 [Chloroflexi bacterium]|nr:hypothetical protein [Chloroflexota bacterium]